MTIQPKSGILIVNCCLGLALMGWSENASTQEANTPARTALIAWDTGKSSTEPLPAVAVAQRKGWMALAGEETPNAFRGDVAISNGRILAVARKFGSGIELYSLGLGQPVLRARLLLAPGTAIERMA